MAWIGWAMPQGNRLNLEPAPGFGIDMSEDEAAPYQSSMRGSIDSNRRRARS
jgi:hypothetical protein